MHMEVIATKHRAPVAKHEKSKMSNSNTRTTCSTTIAVHEAVAVHACLSELHEVFPPLGGVLDRLFHRRDVLEA